MKTATYTLGAEPFDQWLARHSDADYIKLKGTVSLKQFDSFQSIEHLNGKTIDISQLHIRIKGSARMPEHHVISDYYERLRYDIGLETMPLILILVANRKYTEQVIVEDDIIYSANRKHIVYIAAQREHIDLSAIPVENIGLFACYNNETVKSITLPNTLKTIRDYAFADCDNLSSVIFPKQMELLGENCFESTDITDVVLPEGLKELPQMCFAYTSINSVKWPSTLRKLCYRALNFCSDNEIIIPEGVIEIETEALLCVTKVTFPSTLKHLAHDYYYDPIIGNDCMDIPYVTVHPDNPYYYSKNGKLYQRCKLAVRFEYDNKDEIPCRLVSMSEVEWRQFLGLRDERKRKQWMLYRLAMMEDAHIREMWWIPLHEQNVLSVNEDIISSPLRDPCDEELIEVAMSLQQIAAHRDYSRLTDLFDRLNLPEGARLTVTEYDAAGINEKSMPTIVLADGQVIHDSQKSFWRTIRAESGNMSAWQIYLLYHLDTYLPLFWHANYDRREYVYTEAQLQSVINKKAMDGQLADFHPDDYYVTPYIWSAGHMYCVSACYWSDYEGLVRETQHIIIDNQDQITFRDTITEVLYQYDCGICY